MEFLSSLDNDLHMGRGSIFVFWTYTFRNGAVKTFWSVCDRPHKYAQTPVVLMSGVNFTLCRQGGDEARRNNIFSETAESR